MDIPAMAYLFIIFFILALIADHLPFFKIINNISSLGRISIETINSTGIDDPAKQKILLTNSLGLLKESLKIIVFTALLIGLLFLWLILGDLFKPLTYDHLTDYLLTNSGIILSIVSFLSYFLVKKLYVRFRV